ncbi:hypothetical protein D9M68_714860 [compost metagenome]
MLLVERTLTAISLTGLLLGARFCRFCTRLLMSSDLRLPVPVLVMLVSPVKLASRRVLSLKACGVLELTTRMLNVRLVLAVAVRYSVADWIVTPLGMFMLRNRKSPS